MKNNQAKISEEIGRNYRTVDTNPIDFFHDNRIEVNIYPGGADGLTMVDLTMVDISCDDLNFKSPTRSFPTENEAQTWARKLYTQLSTKLDNLNESLYATVLSRLVEGRY